MLSVVIPSYNEEKLISTTAETISKILDGEKIEHQLIFVDDGSKDKTWEQICLEAEKSSRIIGVHFSRNFGKEAAITAGLETAEGDACVVIDCDLQHPPETIVEMYRLWENGYEIVEGVKESRGKESFIRKIFATTFYSIISRAVGFNMEDASDFKLLDRKVVDALKKFPERAAFFRALSFWVGYKKTQVFFTVRERTVGESKWSFFSLFSYALKNITSFSTFPLHAVTILGIISLVVSVVFGVIALYQKIQGIAVSGFTTVILLVLLLGSMIMISLGIIGVYVAKIYEECLGRPRYIISKVYRGRGDV